MRSLETTQNGYRLTLSTTSLFVACTYKSILNSLTNSTHTLFVGCTYKSILNFAQTLHALAICSLYLQINIKRLISHRRKYYFAICRLHLKSILNFYHTFYALANCSLNLQINIKRLISHRRKYYLAICRLHLQIHIKLRSHFLHAR